MKAWTAASALLFLAVAGAVAAVLVLSPAGVTIGGQRFVSTLAYSLESAGEQVTFVLPPGTPRVKVLTRTFAEVEQHMPPVDWVDYDVHVAWLDAGERVVGERTLRERARRSRFPGLTEEPLRNALLRGSPQPLNDERITVVPGSEVVPDGGSVRVTATSGPMLVRVYGERPRSTMEARTTLLGPTARQQQTYAERAGVPDWSLLHRGERRELVGSDWVPLAARGRPGVDTHTRWVMESDLRLGVEAQQTASLYLSAGRKMALNLQGPLTVRVSGGRSVDGLVASAVGDGAGEVTPVEVAAQPVGLYGETRARGFSLAGTGPLSFVLHNPTAQAVGPFLVTLDQAGPEQLFGWTAGLRLDTILPTLGEVTALAPEWRVLNTFRAATKDALPLDYPLPAVETGGTVRLELRPLLVDARDRRARRLTVEALSASERVVWRDAAPVPAEPAPFEYRMPQDEPVDEGMEPPHLPDEDRQWVAEPVTLYATYGPGVATLRVRATDAQGIAVLLKVEGPPQGDDTLYPLPEGRAVVRYAWRPLTTWHRVEPANEAALHEAGQHERIAANVRLEPREPEEGGAGPVARDRAWVTVEPAYRPLRDAARTWLVPPDEDPQDGILWCGILPGDEPRTFVYDASAARALDNKLVAVLWTRDASVLGRTWRVELDGRPWKRGRLQQRVTEVRQVRTGTWSQARLEAPAGTRLWLRTWGRARGSCLASRRGVRAWPLHPGGAATFVVDKTMPEQLFLLGGLAVTDPTLHVTVDDGDGEAASGLHEALSRLERDVALTRVPGELAPDGSRLRTFGQLLDDPDRVSHVLESRAILLGPDLAPGRHRIRVENPTRSMVYLRAAIEATRPERPSADPAPGLVDAPGGEP